ncbi:MAG: adenylate/guanylate cyclase domain-containing protein [Betaproteobacteria bacterium]|nr:adenylate/guanylate cyclase domain-containing protein [Betaproteobacteria bacterium]
MSEIVTQLRGREVARADEFRTPGPRETQSAPPLKDASAERGPLRLTIAEIPHPAYMVNYNFEVSWYNDAACKEFLGGFDTLPARTEARNVFALLLRGADGRPEEYRSELLRLHVALAKVRLSKSSLLGLCRDLDRNSAALLESIYDDAEKCADKAIVEVPLELRDGRNPPAAWRAYATFFREGILIVYVAGGPASESLLDFLSRRDVVIRNLLRRRLPVMTQLAVLVADLQNSVKICSELPPEEYFELINEIWLAMGPIFRKYYGTHGKHVGDGMVYYFFPQPDSHYIFNALACAHEVKLAMKHISNEWRGRKNWLNELYLNTGLHEGHEWLGTFQSATSIEFAVLGDTINHAARLSDFARFGAIWATKNFVGKLTAEERAAVQFGIMRRGEGDREHFVASSYAQLGSLVDLAAERNEKLREIATLPITEIRGLTLDT